MNRKILKIASVKIKIKGKKIKFYLMKINKK